MLSRQVSPQIWGNQNLTLYISKRRSSVQIERICRLHVGLESGDEHI